MTLAKIILQNLIKISSKIYALDSGYNTNSGVLSRFMPACFKTLLTQQQVEKQRQKGNNPFDLIRQSQDLVPSSVVLKDPAQRAA